MDKPTGQEWRPVVGWEGLYEVSDLGLVWSESLWRGTRGRLLRLTPHPKRGYLQVMLYKDGTRVPRKVHRLVAEAFHGPGLPGQEIRHLDGVRINNAASNVAWGTPKENSDDKMRHGTFAGPAAVNGVKTHCIRNHEFTPANTYVAPSGSRVCRICKRDEKRARRAQAGKVTPEQLSEIGRRAAAARWHKSEEIVTPDRMRSVRIFGGG